MTVSSDWLKMSDLFIIFFWVCNPWWSPCIFSRFPGNGGRSTTTQWVRPEKRLSPLVTCGALVKFFEIRKKIGKKGLPAEPLHFFPNHRWNFSKNSGIFGKFRSPGGVRSVENFGKIGPPAEPSSIFLKIRKNRRISRTPTEPLSNFSKNICFLLLRWVVGWSSLPADLLSVALHTYASGSGRLPSLLLVPSLLSPCFMRLLVFLLRFPLGLFSGLCAGWLSCGSGGPKPLPLSWLWSFRIVEKPVNKGQRFRYLRDSAVVALGVRKNRK